MTREQIIQGLVQPWDVVVIGGGINGAGVFSRAAAQGLKVLLLEQRDFGWGTSSRSGKMVHGGLRYLLQGQPRTTWHSVHEREKLLRHYGGLVEHLGFLFPMPKKLALAKPVVHALLSGYELMAGRLSYKFHKGERFSLLAPRVAATKLCGGFSFSDATADDARLVWRVLQRGKVLGGAALNYAAVRELIRAPRGEVRGVLVQDMLTGKTHEVAARVVINASGAWTDDVRAHLGQPARLRRLRGSHIVIPRWRLPLSQAVGIKHPTDGRSMYIMPWEGATMVGTTDIDHHEDIYQEPHITPEEGDYLLEAVDYWFPSAGIVKSDVISTFSGVRPVINTGKADPSKESRDHAIWDEDGLVTMTGGKLTTFGIVAGQGLDAAAKWLRGSHMVESDARRASDDYDSPGDGQMGDDAFMRRLSGRYGADAPGVAVLAAEPDGGRIGDTSFLWAELKWAALHEQAVNLEDIMLRRTRLGLLLPGGGRDLMDRVRAQVQQAMGWDDRQWQDQQRAYLDLWDRAYSPGLVAC